MVKRISATCHGLIATLPSKDPMTPPADLSPKDLSGTISTSLEVQSETKELASADMAAMDSSAETLGCTPMLRSGRASLPWLDATMTSELKIEVERHKIYTQPK